MSTRAFDGRDWTLDPDGAYVGQLEIPDGVYPEAARGDVVWAVVNDQLSVPRVVRYRIAWGR